MNKKKAGPIAYMYAVLTSSMWGIKSPRLCWTASSAWIMYAAAAFMASKRTYIRVVGTWPTPCILPLFRQILTDWLSASVKLVKKTFLRASVCWPAMSSGTEAKMRKADSLRAALGDWEHSNKAFNKESHLSITSHISISKPSPFPCLEYATYFLRSNQIWQLQQWCQKSCVWCFDQFRWQVQSTRVPWRPNE